jgi:hypothetical protein
LNLLGTKDDIWAPTCHHFVLFLNCSELEGQCSWGPVGAVWEQSTKEEGDWETEAQCGHPQFGLGKLDLCL